MAEHKATIVWKLKDGDVFASGKYSRDHTWTFDGGITVPGSAAPSVVPVPLSSLAAIDPEEAFVAAISSCHMLTYLYVAYRQGYQLVSYHDDAVGALAKNEKGVPWVSTVTLHPKIEYTGEKRPTPAEEEKLHHLAHEQCYIANSIKTTVTVSLTHPA